MDQEGFSRHLALWAAGISDEVAFWDRWFTTRGDRWPEDFSSRLDGNREIDPDLMQGLTGKSVLDVGAGPMTFLGHMHDGAPLSLVACDPLAPFYAEIAAKNGIERPIETQLGFAEDLSSFFSPCQFDLVHCRNALDHSFDPVRGIEEMLIVAKPGGRIALEHATNEAEQGHYDGLHQWNFEGSSGNFIIWNKTQRIDASELFAPYADIEVDTSRDRWISVRMRKKAAPAAGGERYKDRLRDVLTAMLNALRPATS